MIIADITVQTSSITVALHDKLPMGAAGLKVRFTFLIRHGNPCQKPPYSETETRPWMWH